MRDVNGGLLLWRELNVKTFTVLNTAVFFFNNDAVLFYSLSTRSAGFCFGGSLQFNAGCGASFGRIFGGSCAM